MRRAIVLAAVCAACIVSVGRAEVVDTPYAFALRKIGEQPAVLDGLRTPAFDSDYRGTAVIKGGLAVNPRSGTVYATRYKTNNRVYWFDPDSEGPADSPVESSMGLVEKGDYQYYRGSVMGGSNETVYGNMRMVYVAFNPLIPTGGYADGVFVTHETESSRRFGEFIAQTASEELGQMNEGSTSSPVTNAARVTFGYYQDSVATFGVNNGLSGWFSFMAFDLHKGVFTPVDDAAGSIPMYRYFVGMGNTTYCDFRGIAIAHVKEARESEPTVDSVTMYNRYGYVRDRDTSKDGKALLVNTNAFELLVPDVDGDLGYGLTQDPFTGHLYILTGTDTESYLCAIAPKIDDDSDVLPTFDVVDLDLESDKTYLTLSTFHADLALSAGLALNGDTNAAPTRLYIGASNAVYVLDVTEAFPPLSGSVLEVR